MKMKKTSTSEIILNISNLRVNDELKKFGVSEAKDWKLIKSLITFNEVPSNEEIRSRAASLAEIAKASEATGVLIGNPRSQFMLSEIEKACEAKGIKIYYPFFVREKIDNEDENGSNYFKSKIVGLIEKSKK